MLSRLLGSAMDAALGSLLLWNGRRPLHATTGQFTTLLARIEYRREEESREVREKKQHDAELIIIFLFLLLKKY